jgi:lipopolysaccharide export LptBFGC system permease protein LptF
VRQVDENSETVSETKGNLLETTSNLKQDNISESLASLDKYFFVDDLYRLTYGDYERLRKQFPNITRREFKAELKKACDWYRQKPEAIKNLHFQILAWLDKHNRKVG